MKTAKTEQKIAVFRALQIGDLLCSIPAIRSLKLAYPNSRITLIGLPWEKSFVRRFSAYFSQFILFPGYPGLPEQSAQLNKIPSFLKRVQNENFDLVLQLQGNGSIVNPLISAFCAKQTAGFYRKEDYKPGELFIEYPEHLHEIKRHLQLMRFLGVPANGTSLEFPINENEYYKLEKLFKKYGLRSRQYMVIHPGARAPERRWPAKYFALIADTLIKQGIKIVLTGTADEIDVINKVKDITAGDMINLAGKVDLGTAAALIENANLLLSNDTGVSHIASALQTRSVVIFSRYSDPKRWAPLNTYLHEIISPEQAKDPGEVILAVEKMLTKKSYINKHNSQKRRVSI